MRADGARREWQVVWNENLAALLHLRSGKMQRDWQEKMRAILPTSSLGGSGGAPNDGWFRKLAVRTSELTGHPFTFGLALGIVIAWAATGPIFRYSDTWQLVINTGTTIVTFLMVFLIQATQNRDTTAIQLKLDELIRATSQANNKAIAAEELGEAALAEMKAEIRRKGDVSV
jgi:low affinity Fe/Cu permease